MASSDKKRGPLRRLKHELRARRREKSANRPPPGPRIDVGRDPVEVHTLVRSADVPMSLWCLSSFIAFTGLRPRIVVHDDGSMTNDDREAYAQVFAGAEVLDPRSMDAETLDRLADFPTCAEFRAHPDFFCGRKLFDLLFVAEQDHVLYLDSDILFFQRPDRLLELMDAGTPCFLSDYQSSYGAPPDEIDAWWGKPIVRRVNAGILHIPVDAYRERLELIERYLAHAKANLHERINKHEQTSHALMMAELDGERLPAEYQIDADLTSRTVSHHFVYDGRQRDRFWYRGVNRIRRHVAKRLRQIASG